MVNTKPFDTADYLDNRRAIICYLAEAFRTCDGRVILRAIENVARAIGRRLRSSWRL